MVIGALVVPGIRNIDPKLIEAANTLGLNRRELIWHVILPGSLPSFFVVLGLRIGDAKRRAVEALTEVGLAHRLNAFPATLSGGEAQSVALARGLVREPKLLLLDEPFAALDALTRIRMHQLIIDLWRKHTPAVLLVTHDVDEAILLADRVIVLANGKIADELRIELPRQRDTGQAGFQAIRARLLGLLGVDVAASHERTSEEPVHEKLRRFANA